MMKKKQKQMLYVKVICYKKKKEKESSLWYSYPVLLCSPRLSGEAFIPVSICSVYKQLHTIHLTAPVCGEREQGPLGLSVPTKMTFPQLVYTKGENICW